MRQINMLGQVETGEPFVALPAARHLLLIGALWLAVMGAAAALLLR